MNGKKQEVLINDQLRWFRSLKGEDSFDASFDQGFGGLIRSNDLDPISLLDQGAIPIEMEEALVLDSIKAYTLVLRVGGQSIKTFFDQRNCDFLGYQVPGKRSAFYLNRVAIAGNYWPKVYVLESNGQEAIYRVEEYTHIKNPDANLFQLPEEAQKAYERQGSFKADKELASGFRMLFNEAMALRKSGDLAQAKAKLQQALDKSPRHPGIYNALGLIALNEDKYKEALDYFNKALQADELDSLFIDKASAYFNRGQTKDLLYDIEGAKADYQLAINLQPDRPAYHAAFAKIHLDHHEFAEALPHIEKALELNSYDEYYYYMRGAVRMGLRQAELALADFEKAQEMGLKLVKMFKSMAILYELKEDFESAKDVYLEAMSLDKEDRSAAVDLTMLLFSLKEWNNFFPMANVLIESSSVNQSQREELIETRGIAYFSIVELEEARKDIEQAMTFDNPPVYLWAYRGMINEGEGLEEAALKDYNHYLEQEERGNIYFYRANIHLSKKDIQSACNDFKRANELDFKRAEEALTAHCNRD